MSRPCSSGPKYRGAARKPECSRLVRSRPTKSELACLGLCTLSPILATDVVSPPEPFVSSRDPGFGYLVSSSPSTAAKRYRLRLLPGRDIDPNVPNHLRGVMPWARRSAARSRSRSAETISTRIKHPRTTRSSDLGSFLPIRLSNRRHEPASGGLSSACHASRAFTNASRARFSSSRCLSAVS